MLSIAANPTALTLRRHKIWCLTVWPLAASDRRETDMTKYFIDSNPILPRDFGSMDNPKETSVDQYWSKVCGEILKSIFTLKISMALQLSGWC